MVAREDDAFRWEGDEDPAPAREERPEQAPPAEQPETPDSAESDAESTDEPRGTGNVALIAYGVLAGVYTLWTVGWILGSGRVRDWILAQPGSVPDPMFVASSVLAVLAPAIWFAVALLLTRGKPVWLRFAVLAVGVIVLVPWPFVTVGVIGS